MTGQEFFSHYRDAGAYTWYDPESKDPFVAESAHYRNQLLESRSRSISPVESIRGPDDFIRADTPSPWEQPNYHSSDEEAPYETFFYPQVDVDSVFAYGGEDRTASIFQEVGADVAASHNHPEEELRINRDSDEDSTPRQIESVQAAHDSDEDRTPTQLTFTNEAFSNAISNIAVGRHRALLDMEIQANRHNTLRDALSEADDTASITYQDIVNFLRISYDPQQAVVPAPGRDDRNFIISPSSAVLPRNEGDSSPSTRKNSPLKCETVDETPEDASRPPNPALPTISSQISLGAESTRFSLRPYLQPAAAFMARSAPRTITSDGGLFAAEQEKDRDDDDDEEEDKDAGHRRPSPPSPPSTCSAALSEEYSFVPSVVRVTAATTAAAAAPPPDPSPAPAPAPAALSIRKVPSGSSPPSSEIHVGSPQGISTSPPFHRGPGDLASFSSSSSCSSSRVRRRLHFEDVPIPTAQRHKKGKRNFLLSLLAISNSRRK
jgi:hypothetical protein